MGEHEVSEQARELGRRGSSKGGVARAQRLSPQERSAIAKNAAEGRWGRSVLPALKDGDLVIGGRTISCAVLDGGVRVISQATLLSSLDRNRRAKGRRDGDAGTVLFAANLRPFIPADLDTKLRNPIAYTPTAGGRALGYPAEVLPEVCDVYLSAREIPNQLLKSQEPAATAAEILMRGLARVGIVALVDEATGYQEVRTSQELQAILEAYVQTELRPWIRMFPPEFFKDIYRIHGWEYKANTTRRTPQVGKLINKWIYEQLPPGVLEELQRINPRTERGYRVHKHHQHLTADTGNIQLDKQISTVMTLMRISRDKAEFHQLFERAFPPPQAKLPFVVEVAEDEN